MKHRKSILASSLLLLALTSCATESVSYQDGSNWEKYVQTLSWHEDFTILQLSDIHWSIGTQIGSSESIIQKIIDEANDHVKEASGGEHSKVDLIEINGDAFMLNNQATVTNFLSFMESQQIPYATGWGNHDREGSLNPNWLSEQFKAAEHSLYCEVDNDDVHERSNYVINLVESDGGSKINRWQVAILDSGASYAYNAISFSRTYDYLRQDQADWWKSIHNNHTGKMVPTIAYYHIPAERNTAAYEEIQEGTLKTKNKFFKLEGFANSVADEAKTEGNRFIEVGRENNLKAIFNAHCHNNDYTFDDDGVTIGCGVKSSYELYYAHVSEAEAKEANLTAEDGHEIKEAFDLVGGSLVTLKENKTFDLEHLYLNENNDGSVWKEWVRY